MCIELLLQERGVELVKEKRIIDAFRRFNKSLKFLIAIEPVDKAKIDEERVKEMIDLKVISIHFKDSE